MKKIIKGKLYDTDTAKKLAVWSNEYYPNDFNFCQERLYRKRTGEYFLFGKGGANSGYRERCYGGGWTAGKNIIPLTYEEARQWAEEKLDADEYAEIFGIIFSGAPFMNVRSRFPLTVADEYFLSLLNGKNLSNL